ncbi:hypothetical protein RM550_31290 [Streptomyces sp. DSM 41527]|uniref:WXG100 family type VII secretion target n=1 Tax=Streptomyces mooreae TaxID=3075523 RepID=A0ABU2TGU9_9ACTN|nr:hypothetical protein [Streptomyces sp. DSM 41527]MDT0460153.1 hypothetical protein [Streptomyces sp. DSM 41527]
MSAKTSVDPGELRAAAHAEDSIAQDMTDKNHKAISATKDAAASLKGWSLSQALEATADSWKPSLDGMRSRAETGASNLRTCADGHDWNDTAVSKDFEAAGAQTQFAPQTMAASAGFGGPGAIGSEGRNAMPGAGTLRDSLTSDSAMGGPGAVGSEGRHAMPGAENLCDTLTAGPGSPGSVGSEGVTPTTRPPFVDRESAPYPGPDPRAEWTADRMQNAEPMQTPTVDSPFG